MLPLTLPLYRKDSLLVEENPDLASFDATLPFLSMAFEDQVFKHVSNNSDIERITLEQIERSGGRIDLLYKDEKKDLIILRDLEKQDGVWSTLANKPLGYTTTRNHLRRILRLLDYECE